jgi:hypothetical protein
VPWTKVVEEYTDLKLTIETDRLAALAGLTAARRLATGHLYLYGMSLSNLPNQLLWQSDRPGRRLNIAPTWSWASTTAWAKYNVQDPSSKVHAWQKYSPDKWERDEHTIWSDGWHLLNLRDLRASQKSGLETMETELQINARLLRVTVQEEKSRGCTRHLLTTVDDPIWTMDTLTIHWDVTDEVYHSNATTQVSPQYRLFIATKPLVPLRGLLLEDSSCFDSSLEAPCATPAIPRLPTYRRVASVSAGPSWRYIEQLEDQYHFVDKRIQTEPWNWSAWAARSSRQTFAIV